VAVTCHGDGAVRLWDASTLASVRPPLTGHRGAAVQVTTGRLPDGRVFAVTGDSTGQVRVWDLDTGSCIHRRTSWRRLSVAAIALGMLRDRQLIALVAQGQRLRRWSLATGRWVGRPIATGATIDCVAAAILPDGRLVAVTGSRKLYRDAQAQSSVCLWDVASGKQIGAPMVGHRWAVNTVATTVLPGGQVVAVSGSSDGSLRVWDLVARRQVDMVDVTCYTGSISDLALVEIRPGRHLAVLANCRACVWELGTSTTRVIKELRAGGLNRVAAGFTPAGRAVAIYSGPYEGRLYLTSLDSDDDDLG
jgi:WD40 repeat protein